MPIHADNNNNSLPNKTHYYTRYYTRYSTGSLGRLQ